jgi:hypothetical protein
MTMTTDELKALLRECIPYIQIDDGGDDRKGIFERELCEKINAALSSDFAVLPREPTDGLLVSMALRLNHGFVLDSEQSRKIQVSSMRQVYEEISGEGFYKVEREQDYKAMLSSAEGK